MSLKLTEELCVMKIYRGVACHDNEDWCKICGSIYFVVSKLTPQFDKLWLEHSNVSNICTLMGSFWPKSMFELKKYRRVRLMALKTDAKLEGKLTFVFQNDMKNLANFHRLKNSDFILESKINDVAKWKEKFETARSTRCSEKTLF